ncbi:MAG: cadmium-translocating P-type ATPase [Clostridia bacterium]|nr:cadmium-translocating P-type ATPase [Clostridia bacterium]
MRTIVRLSAVAALFAAGLLAEGWLRFALMLAAYLGSGYDVLLRAARNITKGRVFDENFLMALASMSAFVIGEHAEAVAVMLFYQVGEAFQARAVGKARRSIAALMDIRPESAALVEEDGTIREVSPEQVQVGDLLLIKPGERIPLDGVVERGHASLDTSALTGEPMPREVGERETALSGCVSIDGLLWLRVEKPYGESTVAKIFELVENAAARKARTERFITRFARIYTPLVVLAALLLALAPPLLFGGEWALWLRRGLTFLVVSCPCALVVSVPLGYFAGIGAASRAGVLCKGGDALDALCELRALAFDKTGTLTKGSFSLSQSLPAPGVPPEELLRAAATAEQISGHPIAASILRAAEGIDLPKATQAQEIAGHGVRVEADGHAYLAGNPRLLERFGICDIPMEKTTGSVVHVARDGRYLGALVVADEIKPDAAPAMAALRRMGVERLVMLTGDRPEAASKIAAQVDIGEVYAGLLPAQKLAAFEAVAGAQASGKVGFVGDGINDAPVLARADIGIAMGGLGADVAIEAADVVLMTDQPGKLAEALAVARKTRRVVRQNIAFALAVKGLALLLSALGIATMWMAVFADVGVSILAVLNAMRAAKQ